MGEVSQPVDAKGEIYLLNVEVDVIIRKDVCFVVLPKGANVYCRVQLQTRIEGKELLKKDIGVMVLDSPIECRFIDTSPTRDESLWCLILTPTISVDDLITYNPQIKELLDELEVDKYQVEQFEFTVVVEQRHVECLQSLILLSTQS